jgi:hypothetical protein
VRGERELSILDTVIAGDNEIITQQDTQLANQKQSASMHEVFNQLEMPYQAFEVDSEEGFARAMQAISSATNQPTRYEFRLPRQDYAVYLYGLSMILMLGLISVKRLEIKQWTP